MEPSNLLTTTTKLLLNTEHCYSKSDSGSECSWTVTPTLFSQNAVARYVGLHSCEFPVSFYNVPASKNIFYVNDTLYTVPAGNYSASSLASVMSDMCGVVIKIDRVTLKFTFTPTDSGTFNGGTMYRILGLKSETTYTTPCIAPYVANLAGPSRLDIYSNLHTTGFSSTLGNAAVLATIGISAKPGDLVQYTDPSNTKCMIPNKTINVFELVMRDENGDELDWNGASMSFVVHIYETHEIRSQPNFESVLEKKLSSGISK